MVPFLVLAAIHWPLGPLVRLSDYAQYILHAEALLSGRSYTDIGYIFSPYAPFAGPEAYPPGRSLALVPLLAAFGRNAALMKFFEIASVVAWLWCAARYLERRTGIWIACGAIMMTGVAVEDAFATNVVNSDLGYAALTWGMLLVADRDGAWGWRRVLAVLLLGTAAMLYRVVGITAVPALGLYAIAHWRRGGRLAAVPVFVWCAVAVVALAVLPITTQYTRTVLTDPASLPARIMINLGPPRTALLASLLYPFTADLLNDIYHAIAVVLMGLGAVVYLRRNASCFLTFFLVCYAGFLLVAPAAVARYWWPLFPVAAAWLLVGIRQLAVRLHRESRLATLAPFVFSVLLVIGAVAVSAAQPAPATLSTHADAQALFTALRNNAEMANARVYFVSPRVLTLETGVTAMPFLGVAEEKLLSELRANGITHVISGDFGAGRKAERTLAATIARHPALFAPLYQNGSFRLYRFRG
jgi:hypothetical protein